MRLQRTGDFKDKIFTCQQGNPGIRTMLKVIVHILPNIYPLTKPPKHQ